jgi:hypothetical protein
MLKNWLPLVLGFVLVIASGYVHGVLTDRWGTSGDVAQAAEKLEKIPHAFGDWHSEPLEIPASQLEAAEAVGHFARVYRNHETHTELQVLILCGPHGPIAVHPPTICFTGAGYVQADPETKQKIETDQIEGTFFETIFTKKMPEGYPVPLKTYWAWSENGRCEAPDNPRVRFAGSGHLYKIYVTRVLSPLDDKVEGETTVCEEFLKIFLPKFEAAVSE